jgi:hypothetical protein
MTRKKQDYPPQLQQDDVRVGVDKGKLRIQFSRSISQEIFGIKQKYFYLRLSLVSAKFSVRYFDRMPKNLALKAF